MTIPRTLFSIAAISAAAPLSAAQDTITVSGEVTCADCRIVLDTVVTIGGLDGPGVETVHRVSMVAVDRLNRIYIGLHRPPSISVFDASGRFIRSIGRAGEGPGEYESISDINAGPRYIHVFDRHKGRTLLDYDFNVVRVDRFPGEILLTGVLESDAVAFSGMVGTRALAGYRFHMLDTLGAFTSFHMGPSGHFFPYLVAAADDGSLLFVPYGRNEIHRWELDPEPALARVLRRRVAEYDRHLHLGNRPGVAIAGFRLDADGLWIAWNAPDPQAPERGRSDAIPWESRHQFKDGWIDLVDPATGLTVARHRHDFAFKGFANGSRHRYLLAYQETEVGVPYIHFLELRLVRGR